METTDPRFSPLGAEHFIREKLKKELSPSLVYHGLHHTEDVLQAAMQIAEAEGLSEDDKQLLRIAVLFHDSGFTVSYKEHEKKGCALAQELLPPFEFSDSDIKRICGMIAATKIPQQPHTRLEQVICDADLDYLGRDDFYTTGNTLFEELKTFGIVSNEKDWTALQISFLESHTYHTNFSKQNRAPQKQKHLEALKKMTGN